VAKISARSSCLRPRTRGEDNCIGRELTWVVANGADGFSSRRPVPKLALIMNFNAEVTPAPPTLCRLQRLRSWPSPGIRTPRTAIRPEEASCSKPGFQRKSTFRRAGNSMASNLILAQRLRHSQQGTLPRRWIVHRDKPPQRRSRCRGPSRTSNRREHSTAGRCSAPAR